MNYDNFIGQEQVINNLKQSILKDTVSHAYIFSGPKGIGKRTLAKIFTGSILCESKNGYESCNECNICKIYQVENNPDCFSISHDKSSISVDEVRGIQSHSSIRPLYSNKKVYIIEDADRMTIQGQNCLLKLFEEPASYVSIILTTSKYDSLIETIRSRAVRLNFRNNSYDEVKGYLNKTYGSTKKDMDFIASYSDGIIGKAIELVDDDEFINLRDNVFKIIEEISTLRTLDISKISGYFEENKPYYKEILDIMGLIYRDILIIKYDDTENVLINFDKKDIMLKCSLGYSKNKLIDIIDIIENTKINLAANTNYSLAIDVMIIKLREEFGQ